MVAKHDQDFAIIIIQKEVSVETLSTTPTNNI